MSDQSLWRNLYRFGFSFLLLLSTQVLGAGLELNQHGVKELGQGFAGTAVLLEDASAIAHNPAGLVGLPDRQFSGAITGIHASLDYNADFLREKVEHQYGLEPTRIRGPNQGRSRDLSVIPALYYSHRLNEDAAVGLGVYAAFGSASKFPENWAGRFHAIETEQSAININPSAAFQATEQLAVGLGMVIQTYEAHLTNRVDVSYLAAESVIQSVEETEDRGTAEDVARDVLEQLGRSDELDISNEIELDSIAFGFNFGLLWELDSRTRLGLNYRSRTTHLATGRALRPELATEELREQYLDNLARRIDELTQVGFEEARRDSEAAVDERGALGGRIQARITLPEIATLSLGRALNNQWDLMASLTWVNWRLLDEVRLENSDRSSRGGSDITESGDDVRRRDLVQPLEFESTLRYGLGVRYQFSDHLSLRAGASYDESPLSNPEFRTPRGPDNDRLIAGLGLSYAVSRQLGMDLAYARIHIRSSRTEARENPSGTLHRASGSARGHIDNLGVQLNYRF